MTQAKVSLRRQFSLYAFLFSAVLFTSFSGGPEASAQDTRWPYPSVAAGFNSRSEGSEGASAGDEGEEEHIETDRDSFTPATSLTGRGLTIVESSYSFIDNRTTIDTHSFPELLVRIGLTDWFELRLGFNTEIGGGGAVSGAEIGGGDVTMESETETSVLYGFKVAVTEQDAWLPRSAVLAHATTPTSGPDTATQFVTGYVFGWTLPNRWELDSAIRYAAASEEGDRFNLWAPSIVLKIPLGQQWNTHVEYFGIFSDKRADEHNPQYFSPGIHYLISPDFEIGVRVGWGLNENTPNFFSNIGLGVRF